MGEGIIKSKVKNDKQIVEYSQYIKKTNKMIDLNSNILMITLTITK